MFLIDDLLFSPLSGLRFILQQIQSLADQELNDPSVLKERLLEVQLKYEEGIINKEELALCEAEIFARLRAGRTPENLWTGPADHPQTTEVVLEVHLDHAEAE